MGPHPQKPRITDKELFQDIRPIVREGVYSGSTFAGKTGIDFYANGKEVFDTDGRRLFNINSPGMYVERLLETDNYLLITVIKFTYKGSERREWCSGDYGTEEQFWDAERETLLLSLKDMRFFLKTTGAVYSRAIEAEKGGHTHLILEDANGAYIDDTDLAVRQFQRIPGSRDLLGQYYLDNYA